ncbi:MAG: flagellar motor protein MotB [Sedimentibacter sp.]
MARKRKKDDSGGASWLETYGDLMTLLLTFFILLYSMSTIDAKKYAAIVASFSKEMNPEVYYSGQGVTDEVTGNFDEAEEVEETETDETDEMDQLYTLLKTYVDENNLSENVQISKTEEYVFIRFSDAITFNGYSNKLGEDGRKILDVLAEGLGLVDEYIEEVIIAGHTAEVENDKTDIDRTLSTDRANAVLKHLENKNVIDPAKYLAIGYGLYSPIADNDTPEGRAKNRRVEIFISRKGYPISYTNIIKETLNGNDDTENKYNVEDAQYQKKQYME